MKPAKRGQSACKARAVSLQSAGSQPTKRGQVSLQSAQPAWLCMFVRHSRDAHLQVYSGKSDKRGQQPAIDTQALRGCCLGLHMHCKEPGAAGFAVWELCAAHHLGICISICNSICNVTDRCALHITSASWGSRPRPWTMPQTPSASGQGAQAPASCERHLGFRKEKNASVWAVLTRDQHVLWGDSFQNPPFDDWGGHLSIHPVIFANLVFFRGRGGVKPESVDIFMLVMCGEGGQFSSSL